MRVLRGLFLACLLLLNLLSLAEPSRIVSLAPNITKSLILLGMEERIVGVSRYSPLKDREIVGSILQINVERIYALSPDLVIATPEGNPRAQVERLKTLGLKVMVLSPERTIADILHNFLLLGKTLGREDRARKIVEETRERIKEIEERWRGRKPLRVFIQVGVNPLVTAGKNTPLHEMVEKAGGENIFSDLFRYPRVNPEEVWRRNPQVWFVLRMGKETTPPFLKDKKVRVYFLDADKFGSLTPPEVVQDIRDIYRYLWEK